MSLKEKLMEDLKDAMKNHDEVKKNTVTMIRAAIKQIEVDKRVELEDNEVVEMMKFYSYGKEIEGTLEDFLRAAEYLLKPRGHIYVVHRPGRLTDIIDSMRELKLEPKEIQMISGKRGETPNIVRIHAIKGGKNELRVLPELTVRNGDGSFTEEMQAAYA